MPPCSRCLGSHSCTPVQGAHRKTAQPLRENSSTIVSRLRTWELAHTEVGIKRHDCTLALTTTLTPGKNHPNSGNLEADLFRIVSQAVRNMTLVFGDDLGRSLCSCTRRLSCELGVVGGSHDLTASKQGLRVYGLGFAMSDPRTQQWKG